MSEGGHLQTSGYLPTPLPTRWLLASPEVMLASGFSGSIFLAEMTSRADVLRVFRDHALPGEGTWPEDFRQPIKVFA